MCGIAGYSLSPESRVERTLAAQALLAGIAERGGDAAGYAFRRRDGALELAKLRGGASTLLDQLDVPAGTAQALLHVRAFTKGHPEIEANNHPIRHGSVVGVHNGVIANDDALLADYGIARHEPETTVDSEAIFALVHRRPSDTRALAELRGTMAAAWLDDRDPEALFLARGRARPLWVGRDGTALFFASTRRALAIVEAVLRLRLEVREMREGRLVRVEHGRIVRERRFRADRRYREEKPHSPVTTPREAVSCLERLAALATI